MMAETVARRKLFLLTVSQLVWQHCKLCIGQEWWVWICRYKLCV